MADGSCPSPASWHRHKPVMQREWKFPLRCCAPPAPPERPRGAGASPGSWHRLRGAASAGALPLCAPAWLLPPRGSAGPFPQECPRAAAACSRDSEGRVCALVPLPVPGAGGLWTALSDRGWPDVTPGTCGIVADVGSSLNEFGF